MAFSGDTKNRIQPCSIGVIPLYRNEIRLASRGGGFLQAPTDHSFSIFLRVGWGWRDSKQKNPERIPRFGIYRFVQQRFSTEKSTAVKIARMRMCLFASSQWREEIFSSRRCQRAIELFGNGNASTRVQEVRRSQIISQPIIRSRVAMRRCAMGQVFMARI